MPRAPSLRIACCWLPALLALGGCSPAKEPAAASVDIAPAPASAAPSTEAADPPAEPDPQKATDTPSGPAASSTPKSSASAISQPAPTPQPPNPNAAKAEQLFDEAKQDMAAGDYAKACPKFEASLKLDFGLGTLMNLAQCVEKSGGLTRACALWGQAAAEAQGRGQPERAKMATDRRRQLGCGP